MDPAATTTRSPARTASRRRDSRPLANRTSGLFGAWSQSASGDPSAQRRGTRRRIGKTTTICTSEHPINTIENLGSWTVAEAGYLESSCGPTNVLFDPLFEENSYIYLSYCANTEETHFTRYKWSPESGLSDPAVIVKTTIVPADPWHRFGSAGFEEDGVTLWMLSGDHFHSEHG